MRFLLGNATTISLLENDYSRNFPIRKKVADPEKVSGKSGNREIWKSADSEISDFSLYNYNRKFWICNTPPLIFPRNPAFPGFGSGKNFPGNREIGKSGNRRILKFLIFPYIVIIGNFGFAIPPPLIFLRNPAILPFIFKKGVDTKISAESIMQNGRVHNTEWVESVMQTGKVYKA